MDHDRYENDSVLPIGEDRPLGGAQRAISRGNRGGKVEVRGEGANLGSPELTFHSLPLPRFVLSVLLRHLSLTDHNPSLLSTPSNPPKWSKQQLTQSSLTIGMPASSWGCETDRRSSSPSFRRSRPLSQSLIQLSTWVTVSGKVFESEKESFNSLR